MRPAVVVRRRARRSCCRRVLSPAGRTRAPRTRSCSWRRFRRPLNIDDFRLIRLDRPRCESRSYVGRWVHVSLFRARSKRIQLSCPDLPALLDSGAAYFKKKGLLCSRTTVPFAFVPLPNQNLHIFSLSLNNLNSLPSLKAKPKLMNLAIAYRKTSSFTPVVMTQRKFAHVPTSYDDLHALLCSFGRS